MHVWSEKKRTQINRIEIRKRERKLNTYLTSLNFPPHTLCVDDDDEVEAYKSYKDRRRNAHTAAEQKRRDAIKV